MAGFGLGGGFGASVGSAGTLVADTDGTLAANSDSNVATQKATKTYVDNVVTGLLNFKGSTDASTNPNYPSAAKGDSYVVSVAGKVGGASGKSVDVGDFVVSIAANAGGTEGSVGTSWIVLEHNLVGALLATNNLSDLANAGTARSNLGLGSLATQSGTFSGTSSGTNTGDQTITLTGDVTGSGTGSFAGTIAAAAVTLAKMANLAANSILGNNTGSPATPIALTAAQVKSLLAIANTDVSGLGTASTLASDTDGTLAANSDSRIPTQKAVKTYVGTAVTGLLKFQSSTDCSGNPNYPAASKGDSYVVSVAGKIGGASGTSVDVGDVYFATADNAGGTQASVGTSWDLLEHNLVGAVLTGGALGTPSSGTLTNCSGTAASLTAGAVTNGAYLNVANAYTVQQNGPTAAITSTSASIAWNLNTAQIATHTFTENTTLANPTNMAVGTYVIIFTQHASSPKTLAYGNKYKWPAGSAPVISATNSAVDIYTFISDGTNMYGVSQKAFA